MQLPRFGAMYGFIGNYQQSRDIVSKLAQESQRLNKPIETHLLYQDIFTGYDDGIDRIELGDDGNPIPGWDWNYGYPPGGVREVQRAPRKEFDNQRGPGLTDVFYEQHHTFSEEPTDPNVIESEAWVVMTGPDAVRHADMKAKAQKKVAGNPIVNYFQNYFQKMVAGSWDKTAAEMQALEKTLPPMPPGYPQGNDEVYEVQRLMEQITPPDVEDYEKNEIPFAPYAQYRNITAYYTGDELLNILNAQTTDKHLQL